MQQSERALDVSSWSVRGEGKWDHPAGMRAGRAVGHFVVIGRGVGPFLPFGYLAISHTDAVKSELFGIRGAGPFRL